MERKGAGGGLAILPALFALCLACEKNDPAPAAAPGTAAPSAIFKIEYHDDLGAFTPGDSLRFSQLGRPYSITKLAFYLSRLRLHASDGGQVELRAWIYGDPSMSPDKVSIQMPPAGTYTALSFRIGLDSVLNKSFALPAEDHHLNMQWPEPMGGGYHFLMLEGHYLDGTDRHGFALHTGRNHTLRRCTIPLNLTLHQDEDLEIGMQVYVNEWLRNPHTYDFTHHGNYTMGNDTLMSLVADNGTDAFTLLP